MSRILVALAVMLMLISCASGAKPTPDVLHRPDLSIAPAQLRAPLDLPDLQGADDEALLRNHVAVARQYHELADQLRALLCSLGSQQGITLNGTQPRLPADCVADRNASDGAPRQD